MTNEHLSFPAEAGGCLEVICDHGSVSVRTGPAGTVEANIQVRNRDAIDLRTARDGRDVRIEARVRRGMGFFRPWDSPRADIEVTLPAGMRLDVRGANASIDVKGVSAEAQLATTNGRIDSSGTRGALTIATTNGAVSVQEHSGVLRARSQNGALAVRGGEGSVELSTSNGKIDLDFEPAAGSENSAETTNGSVTAAVSGNVPVAVDARTVHGSTAIDTQRRTVTGETEARLRIRTTNGSIRVAEGRTTAASGRAVYI